MITVYATATPVCHEDVDLRVRRFLNGAHRKPREEVWIDFGGRLSVALSPADARTLANDILATLDGDS